jgi:hypothetical protein
LRSNEDGLPFARYGTRLFHARGAALRGHAEILPHIIGKASNEVRGKKMPACFPIPQAEKPIVSARSGQKSLDTVVSLAYLAGQTKESLSMHTHQGRRCGYWFYYFGTGLPGVR